MGSALKAILLVAIVGAVLTGCMGGEKNYSGADASELSSQITKPPADAQQTFPPAGNILSKDAPKGSNVSPPPGGFVGTRKR